MNIKLHAMTLHGFRSFKTSEHIDFPDRPGLYLLGGRNEVEPDVGANGTGKSSLWGALCWTLFDRYPNGLRSPSIASWDGDAKPHVESLIEVDGVRHVITRTWRPNRLLLDGTACDQEDVEALLACDLEVFRNSVYIGQGARTFLDYAPTERAGFVSTVLGLDLWDRGREHASRSASHAVKERTEFEKQVERLEGAIEALRTVSFEEQIRQFEDNRKRDLADKEEESRGLNAELADADAYAKKCEQMEKQLTRRLSVLQRNCDTVEDALRKLTLFNRGTMQKAARARAEHEKAAKDFDLVHRDLKCPTCNADLLGARKDEVVADIEKQMGELSDQYRELERERVELLQELRDLEAGVEHAKTERDAMHTKLLRAQSDLRDSRTNARQLGEKLEQLYASMDSVRNRTNHYENKDRIRRRNLGKQQLELVDVRAQRDRCGVQAAMSSFWSKGFAQIRLDLVGEVMKRLENECTANLTDLGLPDWSVEFTLDKETKSGTVNRGFHAIIHAPHNADPVPFEVWSGGEAQRLRLAVAMGLSDMVQDYTGSWWGFEVWDEPCTWLSQDGISMLVDALKQRSQRTGKVVWMLEHRALHAGAFDRVATMVKDEEGSQLIWED